MVDYRKIPDNSKKVVVEYEENCINSSSSSDRYGSWSKDYSSSVTDVYEFDGNDSLPFHSETFLIPQENDTVWVVSMNYDDGDSFGRASGKIDILHVTSNKDSAEELANKIKNSPESYTIEFEDDFGRDISINNVGAGYFGSINYIDVECFTLSSYRKRTRHKF